MPATKKTAAKKTVATKAAEKTAPKKAAKKTAKKTAKSKAPAGPEATTEVVTSTKAPKRQPKSKPPAPKDPTKKKEPGKKKSEKKKAAAPPADDAAVVVESNDALPKASDLLNRTKHHTPAIFKISTRKAAPVVFTLEDVREVLKRRLHEDSESNAKKKKVAKPGSEGPQPPVIAEDAPVENSKHAAASLADILGFGGPIVGTTLPTRTVPRKWKKYHGLLIELRDHVRESLGMHAKDTLKVSQKEDTGDISTSTDGGTDSFNRDFALSVVSSEQEALKEIEAAIERIHNGRYGICEITGEEISSERLEAVPFTRFSLEGQRQHELNSRRRLSRGGSTFLSEGAEGISFGDDDGDN